MRLNAKQIAAYTGGQFLVDPIDASALMTGITWDSREVRPGWLYVALPGERVDGHAFVEAALRAGAAGALVTDAPSQSCALLARELGAAIIEVPNTASAITDLARAWRSHLRGRVIGLTGSVGKTTTKNLTRDVCAAYGSVVATKANQNNELGVPRTLLNADPETAVVVVEMGMRGRGQIAELCDFVRPVWGLITNVGESHIELLGSRENIARAKSELFEALPAGVGRAFANLDDDFAAFMTERGRLSERSVALSGFAGHPDAALRGALERESAACDQAVWAEDVSLDAEGRPRFTLCARDAADHDDGALFATVERVPCALSLTGAHNVDNACAAASVGFALGLDLATIAAALGASVPEPGRQSSPPEPCHQPPGAPNARLASSPPAAASLSSTTPTTRAPIPCAPRLRPSPPRMWPAGASPCSATWASSAASPPPATRASAPPLPRTISISSSASASWRGISLQAPRPPAWTRRASAAPTPSPTCWRSWTRCSSRATPCS